MEHTHPTVRTLYEMRTPLPSDHVNYLTHLKYDQGFEPRVIYDIGACVLQWTNAAKELWSNAEIIAFDAWEHCAPLYRNLGIKHFVGVVSDVDGKTVKFYQNDDLPGGNSYYREIPNREHVFPDHAFSLKQTYALDTIVRTHGFPMPDLIKIDVQGAEMDIIKGGRNALSHARHLIVEMQHERYNEGAPMVGETKPFIESLGWKCTAPLFCNNGVDGDYGFSR